MNTQESNWRTAKSKRKRHLKHEMEILKLLKILYRSEDFSCIIAADIVRPAWMSFEAVFI